MTKLSPQNLTKKLQRRKVLGAVIIVTWAGATILAGVGVGLLIKANKAYLAEEPAPIASANVTVAQATATDISGRSVASEFPELTTSQPVSITQAQAGNTFATLSVTAYQTSAASDGLQPGFTHFGLAQGTVGTDPIH